MTHTHDGSESWAPTTPAQSGGLSPTTTKRILVVDDNEDAADLLRELLTCLGHDVKVANDGWTALKLAQTFLPEIALLDIGMPQMDGRELAARLRQHQRSGPPLRLIAVTGYAADAISPDDGFETHLVKPFDVEALQQLIAQPC